ncbi:MULTISPECIES: glycosyltransferase family 9 protein [unclassified Curtobacterium]|uniref:glycosyltransferase family 9 protein n=1 Tax=unclassified Curtobacterium TaxID=257496 RepID=UPI0008DC9C3E|nr:MULTISPECIES: glycosyltransferase family 9 protein [unclassified Curtobacterium]OII26621.1 glycosyl transferase [Curtobacterium sp. MCBA15_016]OII28600.1 glycosyl transferase [Curtobacterium sp. MCBA15_013]
MQLIGNGGERFDDVREIGVLRGGGLGDLLFAVPALEALAAAYPDARITLLGTPTAPAVLRGRTDAVHAFEELPVVPGVRDSGEGAPTLADFESRLAGRFDLAVQLHGGGRNSNPFLLRLGARHTVGTATEDAEVTERWVRYVYYQHEVLRALEVVSLAGAAPVTLDPRVRVSDEERAAVRDRLGVRTASDRSGRLVAIHPGATDPRRRWSPDRFAAVARARLTAGDDVVLVGDATDVPAAAAIRAALPADSADRVHDRTGALPLTDLPAVLAAADVMVGDDSGPRHLAVAVGTPTVGVFWFGNVVNAGPFDRGRHRVHLSYVTRCPVCGVDVTQVGWTAERCAHDPSYVDEVEPQAVLDDVADLLRTT